MSGMARFEKADSSTSQVEYIHALYPFLNLTPSISAKAVSGPKSANSCLLIL